MPRSGVIEKPWRIDSSPASPRNSAYRLHPNAASVPTEISVSIVAAAWRRFVHAALWNGHAPHVTTGAASVSDSHCQPSNCNAGIIAIAITGTARTAETIRRCRSDASRRAARRRPRRSPRRRRRRAVAADGRVAGRFDLGDQVGRGDGVGEGDLGLLGRVVDRRGDAVHPVELLLDPGRARAHVMPADVELDLRVVV